MVEKKADGPTTKRHRKALDFGLCLFNGLTEQRSNDITNIVMSPLGLYLTMGIACMCASGKTLSEIKQSLNISQSYKDEIGDEFWQLFCKYYKDQFLPFAVDIFIRKTATTNEPAKSLIPTYLRGKINKVDFNNPEAAASAINNWAKEKTSGLMPEILRSSETPRNSAIILAGVMTIMRNWQHSFVTMPKGKFNSPSGRLRNVPMMGLPTTSLKYRDDQSSQFTAVDIPFEDGDLSMLILYPYKDSSIQDLEKLLRDYDLIELRRNMPWTNVSIVMPTFAVESNIDFSKIWKKCGIDSAFSGKSANFSDISDDRLYITDVYFQSLIDINEFGMGVKMKPGRNEKFEITSETMVIDRPFIFAIMSKKHRPFLFGEVRNPTLKGTTGIGKSKSWSSSVRKTADAIGKSTSSVEPSRRSKSESKGRKSKGKDGRSLSNRIERASSSTALRLNSVNPELVDSNNATQQTGSTKEGKKSRRGTKEERLSKQRELKPVSNRIAPASSSSSGASESVKPQRLNENDALHREGCPELKKKRESEQTKPKDYQALPQKFKRESKPSFASSGFAKQQLGDEKGKGSHYLNEASLKGDMAEIVSRLTSEWASSLTKHSQGESEKNKVKREETRQSKTDAGKNKRRTMEQQRVSNKFSDKLDPEASDNCSECCDGVLIKDIVKIPTRYSCKFQYSSEEPSLVDTDTPRNHDGEPSEAILYFAHIASQEQKN